MTWRIELHPWWHAVIFSGILFMSSAVTPRAWPDDAVPSGSVEAPVHTIRSIKLYWNTVNKAKLKKLQARLQTLVGQSFPSDSDDALMKEMYYLWSAGPNTGGRIWGESVPGGIKLVISVRGIPESDIPMLSLQKQSASRVGRH